MDSLKQWIARENIKRSIDLNDLQYILQELDAHEVSIKISSTSPISYGMLAKVSLKYIFVTYVNLAKL